MDSNGNGVDGQNAKAILETLSHWQGIYDLELSALRNEVLTLKALVAKQNQVLGDALQRLMGTGSTVRDDGP